MINVLLDPNQMPNQSLDQQEFDNRMAVLMRDLPTFAAQMNDTAGNVNALSAGGAYALPYLFDTATADADPGAGRLRLSSAAQNTALTMRLDVSAGGQDVSAILDTFDDSTSSIKGSIRLVKMGDASKWMVFNVTAVAAPAGYRNVAVTCIGCSSASPFVNGDAVMLYFQRNGDSGVLPGATEFLQEFSFSSPLSSIDFLNRFSGTHDTYLVEFFGWALSSTGAVLLRVAIGGVLSSATIYAPAATHGGSTTGGMFASCALSPVNPASGYDQPPLRLTFQNVNVTGPKSVCVEGSHRTGASAFCGLMGGAYIDATQPLTGFSLFPGAGNFTKGTVRIYGLKKS